MAHYIDKDDLVVEIERLKCELKAPDSAAYAEAYIIGAEHTINTISDVINTLEVKEVNLDESARHYLLHEHTSTLNEVLHQADLKVEIQYHKDIENAFKAGFELGMAVSNKAQKGEEI